MRTLPPTRRTSIARRFTSTSTRSFRLAALITLIALAATALAATNSSAASLGRMFFAKVASVIAGAPAPAKASSANHALETEAAAVETSSPTMTTERRGHTATRLHDGRVLIAGGENSTGPLNQTEIYDPATATFSPAGNMNEARADHSSTLLADGRVVIIGGRNASGALTSTEIFDPATGVFTSGPSMSVARAGHSATLFADGRVLVAGGNESGSAEVLAADLSGFTAVGGFYTARSMHSTAVLQDGRVLVVGGRDADGNQLSSAEIFDPAAGGFAAIDSALQVARVQPHLRVLFDGKVQIIGGSNDGSIEIYDPYNATFGAYVHVAPEGDTCAGLPGQVQASQTRAALFHNGQIDPTFDRSGHTMDELGSQAIVIGGSNTAGAVMNSTPVFSSSSAAISTDKLDYAPGETAHISGRGFGAGETVRLKIHEDPHTPQERGFDIVADGDGNFTGDYLVQQYDVDMKFLVGARGLTSGRTAQTSFTDGNPNTLSITVGQSPNPLTAGSSATYTVSLSYNGNANNCTVNLTATPIGAQAWPAPPVGGFFSFSPTSLTGNGSVSGTPRTSTLTINTPAGMAAGTYNFQVGITYPTGNGCQNTNQNPTVNGTLVIAASTVNTTTAVTNATATYGDASVTLNATVTPASGPAVNNGSVTFTVKQGPTTIGVATTDNSVVAGAASVSYALPPGTNAGPYTIEASYTPGAGFNASSGTGSLTINKRNTLTTVSSLPNPSTFGESVSFSASVVGTGAGAGDPSGGSVQFKIDGANFGAAVALSGGSASSGSISTLTAGNHTVEAVFTSPDTNFNDSNDALDGGQVVNKRNTLTAVSSLPNPSTFGQSVSFSATVVGTGAGAGDPTGGSVQFKIDGANFGAPVALSSGSASSGSISSLTAGTHTVEAFFTSGDANFNDSSDALDGGQVVNKRNTLTTVSSLPNPSTFGQSVSFSATVVGNGAGAGDPSGGLVQFKIDGANFGAAVALSSGSASSGSISSLTAGTHSVEAVFTSADANFNDSNDFLDDGQVVNKRATQTTTSSSLNPSTYGQSVTFSATVVGTGPGAGNPTGGSVQFKIDGANFGGPVALSSGSATSSAINSLSAGNHTVEAVFTSSDANFSNSSDLLDGGQCVNKASLTITASSHTIIFNDAVPTITASYSGFVLGEGPTNLTTQPTCSTTYTVGSLIGSYPSKCESAASSNYNLSYINGTVTVLTACSAFNGFLPPIGGAVESFTGGNFANPLRSFKLNSTIPVKFTAICFGAPLTTGIHTLQAIKYSNATTSDAPIDATPTDSATSGNQFRLTDGEWHFNLNTKALGGNGQGIYLLKATLFDGSTYSVWVAIKK